MGDDVVRGTLQVTQDVTLMVSRNIPKSTVKNMIEKLPISEAQKSAAKSAAGRLTSESTIEIVKANNGNVIVNITRPGRDGYQMMQSVISANGYKIVVQYGLDALDNLTHYHLKYLGDALEQVR
jgi:hypothetical protein